MKVFRYILTSLLLLYSVTCVAQTTQEVTQGTEVEYHISTSSGTIYYYIWSVDNEKDSVVMAPDTTFTKIWDNSYPVNSSHTVQVLGKSPELCSSAPRKLTVQIKADTSEFSNNGYWTDLETPICPYPRLNLQVNLTKVPAGKWYINYEVNGTSFYTTGGNSGDKILAFSIDGAIPELASNGAKTILLRGIYIVENNGKTQIIYNDDNAPKLNFNISRPQISNIKF